MNTFSSIFKRSFLEGYANIELSTTQILIVMFFSLLVGIYIYLVYRFLTKKTFYSKSFNMSLVLMSVITAAIILTVQSSVVISLGMVGALSIVRFRTAVKDPMDLVFLFWSISVGIRFSGQALMQAPQRIQADGSGNSRPLRASSAFCCRRITASSAFAIA